MVDVVTIVAVLLLLAGIFATLIPLVPGSLLSLLGVYLHWVGTGFDAPGTGGLAVLTLIGLVGLATELFGNAVAARIGGGSWRTAIAALVVGIVLALVTGPIGLLVGLFGTVFALEFWDHGDVDRGIRTAVVTMVGIFASTAIQVLLTTGMLVLFLLILLW